MYSELASDSDLPVSARVVSALLVSSIPGFAFFPLRYASLNSHYYFPRAEVSVQYHALFGIYPLPSGFYPLFFGS